MKKKKAQILRLLCASAGTWDCLEACMWLPTRPLMGSGAASAGAYTHHLTNFTNIFITLVFFFQL